jgi:uncharacterized protein YegL
MEQDGKIEAMNQAVREMISTFAAEEDARAEIQVCIITFGGEVRVHTPLKTARAIQWADMGAGGDTPLGAAMVIAANLIDDEKQVPSRAYRPTVLLVSDGIPTDDWQAGLRRLTQEGRAQKADRLALAIGGDADEKMLAAFLPDPAKRIFHAEDARKILGFFRFVTMSVTARSRSANPNVVPPIEDPAFLEQF